MINKSPGSAAEIRLNIYNPNIIYDIAATITQIVLQNKSKQIIILCIGTDRSTGDALGPLIGSKLKDLTLYPHVYGTLEEPVHATNLLNILQAIRQKYQQPFIIAIDACLGRSESVGSISVGVGSVKPGAAVNKDLPAVGDVYITGIVNVGGFMEHLVLQSTRLSLVMKMADSIAAGISQGLQTYPMTHPF